MTSVQERKLQYLPVSDLKPDPRNPRKHTRVQIRAIAKSIKSFGFNAPVLVDRSNCVVAGHGRLEAAKLLGLEKLPVISLSDLTQAQARAFQIADNRLTERSVWDEEVLAKNLKELSSLVVDFDLEDTGFELPEIDLLIQGLDDQPEADTLDEFEVEQGPAVSRVGDLWQLGQHRLLCGSALDPEAYGLLLGKEVAAGAFLDPPYNVKIGGNVSGLGSLVHREFVMASGEMTPPAFTDFLTKPLSLIQRHSAPGSLILCCMDWRHMAELQAASHAAALELLNLIVWVKTNGGMGSLYRSQHELIFLFRNGSTPHRNNVQLGKYGRNRSNVWTYPGATSFGKQRLLSLHPTVKPVGMVSDAILDCTAAGEVVLDSFMGSGTTILACERTGRRARGMELDPIYCDTAIERWRRMTRQEVFLASGEAYEQIKKERTGP